jgi:hypothetical protein
MTLYCWLLLQAMTKNPRDATLFANRSHICWLRLREGERALSDARRCKTLRLHWAKAWYREGMALSFLKVYHTSNLTLNLASFCSWIITLVVGILHYIGAQRSSGCFWGGAKARSHRPWHQESVEALLLFPSMLLSPIALTESVVHWTGAWTSKSYFLPESM